MLMSKLNRLNWSTTFRFPTIGLVVDDAAGEY